MDGSASRGTPIRVTNSGEGLDTRLRCSGRFDEAQNAARHGEIMQAIRCVLARSRQCAAGKL